MTIKEMEPMIDDLNLEKLEVKLSKGQQVHFFICGNKLSEKDGYHYGDIIIFDNKGHAWKDADTRWEIGNTYSLQKWPGNGLPFQCFRIFNPAIPEDDGNWRGIFRDKHFDLVAEGGK